MRMNRTGAPRRAWWAPCLVLALAACDAEGEAALDDSDACVEAKCDDVDQDENAPSQDAPQYDFIDSYQWILDCRAHTDGVIFYDHLDPARYSAQENTAAMGPSHEVDPQLRRQDYCMRDMANDSDFARYLRESFGVRVSNTLDNELDYDERICDLAWSTHTTILGYELRDECKNRAAMHRAAAFMRAHGVAEGEPLGAEFYPECFGGYDETDDLASAQAVLACVRETNELVFERVRASLHVEALPEDEVDRCLDLDDLRKDVEFECALQLAHGGQDFEHGVLEMCQAEIEATVVPLFSSMREFDGPSGLPDRGC